MSASTTTTADAIQPFSAFLRTKRDDSVDEIVWLFARLHLDNRMLRAKGEAFQTLFRELMERAFSSDFSPVRPHGAMGDRKCDGYLRSQKMVFQVYAPKVLEFSAAKKKMLADHRGARKHWAPFMGAWTFVHNDIDGLPPDLQQVLLRLHKRHAPVVTGHWNQEQLGRTLNHLTRDQLTAMFGALPDRRALSGVTQESIGRVVADLAILIEHAPVAATASGGWAVPPGKIEHNRFTKAAAQALRQAGPGAAVVHQYFEQHTDVNLASEVTQKFARRYVERRDAGKSPDEILAELQDLSGFTAGGPTVQVAAISLLAYLFERCHIFERPPDAIGEPIAAPNENPVAPTIAAGHRVRNPKTPKRTEARLPGLG